MDQQSNHQHPQNNNQPANANPDHQVLSMVQVSESEFHVPANDTKGHSSRLQIRIHPGHATELQRVLDSKWFAYTNTHQIIRHALKRHFEWLNTLAPIPNSVMRRTNAIMEILYEEEQQEQFMDILNNMSKRVGNFLGAGLVEEARDLVNRTYREIEQMPKGAWKARFMKKMNESYGYLLDDQSKQEIVLLLASMAELGEGD